MGNKNGEAKGTAKRTVVLPPTFGNMQTARECLNNFSPRIKGLLARRIPPELFAQAVMTEIQKNPKLLDCDSLSFLGAVFETAILGLTFGASLGHAFLIPYGNKATLLIGYKAYPYLARREGAHMWAENHHKGDEFQKIGGSEHKVILNPNYDKERSWTTLVGSCAFIRYVDGFVDHEYLTREQIIQRRDCSAAYQKGQKDADKRDSPWYGFPIPDSLLEMVLKTATRKLGKRCGLGPLQRAATIDEAAELGINQQLEAAVAQVLELPPGSVVTENGGPADTPSPGREPIKPPQAKE